MSKFVAKCIYLCADSEHRNKKELACHYKVAHPDARPYACTEEGCSSTFGDPRLLKIHEVRHRPEEFFRCTHDGCEEGFAWKGNLVRHMKRHLAEEERLRLHSCTFDSDSCQKAFYTSSELRIHVNRVHKNLRPFLCTRDGCDRAFSRANDLHLHQLRHTDSVPKTYHCDVSGCSVSFGTRALLRDHLIRHAAKYVYNCDAEGCSASFVTRADLKQHGYRHGERRFACHVEGCGSLFFTNGELSSHTILHSDERKHTCAVQGCGASFKLPGGLTLHSRKHDQDRPFVCQYAGCGKTFKLNGNLKIHAQLHANVRPYACNAEGCGATFYRSHHVTSHKFYWHTREGQVRKKLDEGHILTLLNSSELNFKEQHAIDFVCLGPDRDGDRGFIDFLVEIRGEDGKVKGYVLLEVDEKQHESYGLACELRRMADVQRSLALEGNTLPVAFLRYNPDIFKIDGVKQKKGKRQRERKLLQVLNSFSFDRPFSVMYMYYDEEDGEPAICSDPAYPDSFKQYLIPTRQ